MQKLNYVVPIYLFLAFTCHRCFNYEWSGQTKLRFRPQCKLVHLYFVMSKICSRDFVYYGLTCQTELRLQCRLVQPYLSLLNICDRDCFIMGRVIKMCWGSGHNQASAAVFILVKCL